MRKLLVVSGLSLMMLVGCQGSGGVPSSVSTVEVVDISIATLQNGFTLALIGAKVYTDLPRCETGPRICSDREVVKKIREYAIKAHDAIIMAKENKQLIGMAVSAVNQFSSIIPKS